MHAEQPVEDLDVAMIGESEVADAPSLTLFHAEVQHAVVDITSPEGIHATTTDRVQQVVVDVVHLQLLHRVAIHLDARLASLRLRTEVR